MRINFFIPLSIIMNSIAKFVDVVNRSRDLNTSNSVVVKEAELVTQCSSHFSEVCLLDDLSFYKIIEEDSVMCWGSCSSEKN